jgi:membrane fusion protein (multidrug efflux system)
MRQAYLLYIGISLLTFFSRCHSNAGDMASTDSLAEASLPQEQMITEVVIALAAEKAFMQEIETSGTIEARKAAEAVWETGGLVAEVHVQNGQRIQKGQLLAVLENRQEELQLKKARIALKEKQISYESELLGADSMRRYYLKYHSGLASAEVLMEEAELAFEKTMLRAPISGVLSDLQLSVGRRVKAGEGFCHIWNPDELNFTGHVMETQLGSLQKGQQAMLKPFGSQAIYKAVLQDINTRVNEHGLIEICLRLQKVKDLIPGRHAKAYIQIPHDQTIVVPKEAVVMRSGKPVVFSYAGGFAKWNYVSTALENAEEIQVIEGLKPQDSIIISNNLQLAHDARVKFIME